MSKIFLLDSPNLYSFFYYLLFLPINIDSSRSSSFSSLISSIIFTLYFFYKLPLFTSSTFFSSGIRVFETFYSIRGVDAIFALFLLLKSLFGFFILIFFNNFLASCLPLLNRLLLFP